MGENKGAVTGEFPIGAAGKPGRKVVVQGPGISTKVDQDGGRPILLLQRQDYGRLPMGRMKRRIRAGLTIHEHGDALPVGARIPLRARPGHLYGFIRYRREEDVAFLRRPLLLGWPTLLLPAAKGNEKGNEKVDGCTT